MERLRILLVEDNADDVTLVRRTVSASGDPLHLDVASSGEEAVALLGSASQLPAVIFLDISLPGLSGLDVLRHLKGSPVLQDVPVIMLSGSENDEDVQIGCELGAHSHFVKPMSAQDMQWVTTTIRRYWERIAALAQL